MKAKIQDNEAISSNFVGKQLDCAACSAWTSQRLNFAALDNFQQGTACFSQVGQVAADCLKTHHGPVCEMVETIDDAVRELKRVS